MSQRRYADRMKTFVRNSRSIQTGPRVIRGGLFFVALSLLALTFSDLVGAAQVTVAWDPSVTQGVSGYKVYYGTQSKVYTLVANAGSQVSVVVPSLQEGLTYYFAAKSYDSAGRESAYSNEVPYVVPTASSCTYTISPTSQSIVASGGQGSVNVATQSACTWTATGNASWITLSTPAAKTGSGILAYTVGANTGSAARSAAVTVAGKILTISQAATTIKYYTITASADTGGTISPSGSVSVASGGSKRFSITPASGHRIRYLVIDGRRIWGGTSYTFTNVQTSHSIRAAFS
jgi:hypothetical protein